MVEINKVVCLRTGDSSRNDVVSLTGIVLPAGYPKRRWRCAACAPSLTWSGLELGIELLLHRHALDLHVVGEAVLVRRIVFTGDQRLEVGAAFFGDAEAVRGDEIARHHLLDIRDVGELHV